MQVEWYRVASIPVLLSLLLLGFVGMLFLETMAAGKGRAVKWIRGIYGVALLGYMGIYLYLTFFSRSPNGLHRVRLVPFYSLMRLYDGEGFHLKVFREAFLNIILYVPFGSLMMAVLYGHPHTVRMTILAGLVCTLATEIAQFAFGMGLAEVDDVIHNSLGGFIGMMGFQSAHSAASCMMKK